MSKYYYRIAKNKEEHVPPLEQWTAFTTSPYSHQADAIDIIARKYKAGKIHGDCMTPVLNGDEGHKIILQMNIPFWGVHETGVPKKIHSLELHLSFPLSKEAS